MLQRQTTPHTMPLQAQNAPRQTVQMETANASNASGPTRLALPRQA